MYLKRTGDGYQIVKNDDIKPVSIWRPAEHHVISIPTVTGVMWDDTRGVAQVYKRVRFWFADHYDSTLTDFRRLWQAQRYRQALTFQDRDGTLHNVRIHTRIDPDSVTLWEEVPNRDIAIVEVELRQMEYYE